MRQKALRSAFCTFLGVGQCQDLAWWWASVCLDDYMGGGVWCSHTAVTWHLCTLVLTVPQKIDVLMHLYTLRTFILYRTQILAHENIT